jgi:pimeloyl-ACP methyl ester carboxylesterase
MYVASGGNGAPALLLLHGLGANAAVWCTHVERPEKVWALFESFVASAHTE